MDGNVVEKNYNICQAHGEYVDYIYKGGKLVETREGHNIVVNVCSKLLAGLVAGKIAKGGVYWAIGSGSDAWDAQYDANTPPTPSAEATILVNEIARIPLTAANFKFVDGAGNELADTNFSNRIKCTITVSEDVANNGKWREFGLFGGTTATATADTGIMIDHIYHNVFNKSAEFSVTRVLTLTF